MEEFSISQGYPALFIVSFLASTILPLGSEWLLIALILNGFHPGMSVVIATCGNSLGALTTYWIGLYGSHFLMDRVLGIGEESQRRAERLYARFGFWSLLFSWVPVIGDPLCLAGGILRIRFLLFLVMIFSGKLARYMAISYLTLKFAGN